MKSGAALHAAPRAAALRALTESPPPRYRGVRRCVRISSIIPVRMLHATIHLAPARRELTAGRPRRSARGAPPTGTAPRCAGSSAGTQTAVCTWNPECG